MKMTATLVLVLGFAFALAHSAIAQVQAPAEDATIPEEFRPLYQDLKQTLRDGTKAYPFTKGSPRPLIVPNLFMAASMFPLLM